MDIVYLDPGEPNYPAALTKYLSNQALPVLASLGNLDILKEKKTALFCSTRCPGELIIKTHDLAKKWRDDGVTIIGGFHSPMEQECLAILLRGKQHVIICPARSIEGMRMKEEYKESLSKGRCLILSACDQKERRITETTSQFRNRFVAALADEIFIAHADRSGKTEQLCLQVQLWNKSIYTIESRYNDNLISLGLRTVGKISEEENGVSRD